MGKLWNGILKNISQAGPKLKNALKHGGTAQVADVR
jgi:hypothetical protein